MEPSSPYRPRVSRETRLLLTTGIAALAVLWLLARVRFQDRPVTPNPVPAVLSQLGNGPHFDELAADIAQLQTTLEPTLITLRLGPGAELRESPALVAIRWRDDLAIGLVPQRRGHGADPAVVARDPASGIAVIRSPSGLVSTPVTPWAARRPQQPRFLAVAEPGPAGPLLRPVFVGGLIAVDTALWSEPVWGLPGQVALVPGSVVFTSGAELVGLVVSSEAGPLIVPAASLFEEASRLMAQPPAEQGSIGVEAQAITPALATLTGTNAGVIVTWVDRAGPAAGTVRVGDVIEAIDGQPIATRKHWDAWRARLRAGTGAAIRLRRGADLVEKTLTAAAVAPRLPSDRSLGLGLRARRGIGVEVVSVESDSAAAAAGLAAGDLITLWGDIESPTAAQLTRAFAALPAGGRVMAAFTRGDTHHVTAVQR
jgi:S1-C subfamily serine protease